jgi:hypothetical protein
MATRARRPPRKQEPAREPELRQRDQLRLVIRLSMACMAAMDRDDFIEARRLMQIRDAEYLKLEPREASVFGRWYELPAEQLAALLGEGAPS